MSTQPVNVLLILSICQFLLITKSKPALIIELKKDSSAKVVLEQIKERDYVSRVKEYTENILLIGINYDSKTK